MKKRIVWHTPEEGPVEFASFELLADGRVVADYKDSAFGTQLEQDGIWTLATGWVTPADGKRFFDALENAYANSSFIFVRPEPL